MEPLVSRNWVLLLVVFFFWVCFVFCVGVRAGDAEELLNLKSTIDHRDSLQWQGRNVCEWQCVKECMNGRVTKLVLEYLNLTGALEAKIVNQLDQLRVISFKGNSISGEIPDLSGLVNLKSLFLNDNNFSGKFLDSITDLHRLKVVVLAGNNISDDILVSLLKLRRLYVLYLQENSFTGNLPHLNQSSLRFFNVSNNNLSGEISVTPRPGPVQRLLQLRQHRPLRGADPEPLRKSKSKKLAKNAMDGLTLKI